MANDVADHGVDLYSFWTDERTGHHLTSTAYVHLPDIYAVRVRVPGLDGDVAALTGAHGPIAGDKAELADLPGYDFDDPKPLAYVVANLPYLEQICAWQPGLAAAATRSSPTRLSSSS